MSSLVVCLRISSRKDVSKHSFETAFVISAKCPNETFVIGSPLPCTDIMLSNDLVLFKGNTQGDPYPIDLTLPLKRLFHIAHKIAATPGR